MAKRNVQRTSLGSDAGELAAAFKDAFGEMLSDLSTAEKAAGDKFFKNGIELIRLTINVGANIKFSVVVAGAAAPAIPAEDATELVAGALP